MKITLNPTPFIWETTSISIAALPLDPPALSRWQQILAYLRVLYAALAVVFLAGCASKPAAAWLLYSDVSYQYGRIEAKTELLCAPPIRAALADYCREASNTQQLIKQLKPIVRAELAKETPDWDKIASYVGLVLSLAGAAH